MSIRRDPDAYDPSVLGLDATVYALDSMSRAGRHDISLTLAVRDGLQGGITGSIVPDQINPRGMGGAWRGDPPDNIQAVYWWCNGEKGSKRI